MNWTNRLPEIFQMPMLLVRRVLRLMITEENETLRRDIA